MSASSTGRVLVDLLADLERRHTTACVLRNFEALISAPGDYKEQDFDLLVAESDVETAREVLNSAGFVQVGRSLSRFHLDFALDVGGTRVAVDLHAGAVCWNGIPYARARSVLVRRQQDQGIPIPGPADEVALLTLHCILDKRAFSERYQSRIAELIPVEGPSAVVRSLTDFVADRTAAVLTSYLVTGRYSRAAALRNVVLLNIGVLNPQHWPAVLRSTVGWRLRRLWPLRRGLLVAIVGPHGVGKSTVTSTIIDRLSADGWGVKRFYMGRWRDHVLPIAGVARSYGVTASDTVSGTRSASADTQQVHGRRVYRTARDLAYVADLVLRWALRLLPATYGHDLVLTDRYAYDLLFDRSITTFGQIAITYLYPRPDLCFFLHNDAHTLKARRSEHTLAEIERQLDVFNDRRKVLNLIPVLALDPIETADRIEQRIRSTLGG